MASLDLAHRRTTFNPVFSIFSVNWSTAVFEGAQTKIGPPCCFTNWYTMVAEVTVFPVPGGPKIKIIQVHKKNAIFFQITHFEFDRLKFIPDFELCIVV